ncbi:hypothetical protein [Algoriphagus sp. CAU 1675]|uniref:hypothetical protein n=1 Tax=Algoriphagus sp. CAU 1675 TaxID=3032597 RepID=UPI0023DC992F|nr:hypothetical protein [Algoriphagus sp. CAU 1675]MDF2157251.1 hypothetical protein [Algoriphagus sp. CAU 1675]
MAVNLVSCTYYGLIQLNAEELVETNPLQEILEDHSSNKSYYVLSFSFFQPLGIESQESKYFGRDAELFSTYTQEIHVPPPNSLSFFL